MPVYPTIPRAPGEFPLLPQEHDQWGDPICPTCLLSLRAGVGVLRHEDQMVHVDCGTGFPESQLSGTTSAMRAIGQ